MIESKQRVKLITFLGTGAYDQVYYKRGDFEMQTHLFPIALCHLLDRGYEVVECCALVTEGAKGSRLQELQEGVATLKIPVNPVSIPDGENEEELWTIFNTMTSEIEEGDHIVFDITHGFRFLPFLSFLAASFIRSIKSVTIEGVFYGNFDMRKPKPIPREKNPEARAPIFDLTLFVNLLDWTGATEQFLQTGDTSRIGEMLQDKHRQLRTANSAHGSETLPIALDGLGKQMGGLSLSLGLMQPREVLLGAHKLIKRLDQAIVETDKWVPPFSSLLDRIREDFSPLAFDIDDSNLQTHLKGQWLLIKWYFKRNQIVQAASLSREWMVSIACSEIGLTNWISETDRKQAELSLHSSVHEPASLKYVPRTSVLSDVWRNLAQFRNQIDHCGMQTGAIPSSKLFEQVKRLQTSLREIAISYNFEEEIANDENQ